MDGLFSAGIKCELNEYHTMVKNADNTYFFLWSLDSTNIPYTHCFILAAQVRSLVAFLFWDVEIMLFGDNLINNHKDNSSKPTP